MTATRNWRLEGYAQDARSAIAGAQSLADERSHAEVESIHLLFRLLDRDALTQKAFENAGVDPGDAIVETEAVLRKITQVPGAVAYLSPRMLGLCTRAEAEAAREASQVRVRHLVVAILSEPTSLAGAVLRALDVDEQRVRQGAQGPPRQPHRPRGGRREHGLVGAAAVAVAVAVAPTTPSRSTRATCSRRRSRTASTPSWAGTASCGGSSR